MKFVRCGALAAEVNVEILEEEGSWAPYLSLEDAYKLDDVRDALRAGDIERASRLAERVYRLTPVGVSGETTGGTDDANRSV
jgi:FAD synthase